MEDGMKGLWTVFMNDNLCSLDYLFKSFTQGRPANQRTIFFILEHECLKCIPSPSFWNSAINGLDCRAVHTPFTCRQLWPGPSHPAAMAR
eukprot:758761-Hanusia_phi.AAC.3